VTVPLAAVAALAAAAAAALAMVVEVAMVAASTVAVVEEVVVVRPAILVVALVTCHVTAPRVGLRNATTVANKVISLAIAHPSPRLSASATNASNQDTCSPLAPIR